MVIRTNRRLKEMNVSRSQSHRSIAPTIHRQNSNCIKLVLIVVHALDLKENIDVDVRSIEILNELLKGNGKSVPRFIVCPTWNGLAISDRRIKFERCLNGTNDLF